MQTLLRLSTKKNPKRLEFKFQSRTGCRRSCDMHVREATEEYLACFNPERDADALATRAYSCRISLAYPWFQSRTGCRRSCDEEQSTDKGKITKSSFNPEQDADALATPLTCATVAIASVSFNPERDADALATMIVRIWVLIECIVSIPNGMQALLRPEDSGMPRSSWSFNPKGCSALDAISRPDHRALSIPNGMQTLLRLNGNVCSVAEGAR